MVPPGRQPEWQAQDDGLGVYPDVELGDARKERDRLRKLIAAGVDPVTPISLRSKGQPGWQSLDQFA